ncbi:thioesterase family protein [Nocardia sp. NEAU-G5]|uniref:Thioesterase family protein n=1 Tax=Nocardia albiluteola TaxID=2842303 RepID=A0ABS6B0Y3_9NOCA|nr:acyl-CoA thioesterase domain-containing protein [Nocardia albiluteola]MBU3063101.1 thioesterase family protein [Nocardia albiluteola]
MTYTQTTDFEELLNLLALDPTDADTFTGHHPTKSWKRVFGGQFLAQAVMAAGRTVTDYERRPLHTLSAHFVRAGSLDEPVSYHVERLRDGRSLASRAVTAYQGEQVVAVFLAGFQASRAGLEHQVPMPRVPAPQGLPQIAASFADREGLEMFSESLMPLDIRYTDAPPWVLQKQGRRPTVCRAWMRADGTLPDAPLIHAAVLAYASDQTPLDPIVTRYGLAWGADRIVPATLDHHLWIHRPPRMNAWTLYATQSPTAAGSRALVTGQLYTDDGMQIATVTQEDAVLAYRRGTAS